MNVGCVPSKRLLEASRLWREVHHPAFAGLAIHAESLDFASVIREKDALVASLGRSKYTDVLENLEHVTFVEGGARFLDARTVEVAGRRLRARHFLIATGSSPRALAIPGIEGAPWLDSERALALTEVPESLVVVGGGPAGMEFAQILSRFGARVTIVHRGTRILPRSEPEIAATLAEALLREGVRFVLEAEPTRIEKAGSGIALSASGRRGEERIEAEKILIAAGRVPNTARLGLSATGVRTGAMHEIIVDSAFQTNAPHIHAAGDVTGMPMLETIAGRGGALAAENALTGSRHSLDLEALPAAVFTDPQVAQVGMTEEQARSARVGCLCRTVSFDHVPKAHIIARTEGRIKIVAEETSGRIRGVHVASALAAEIIHAAVLIVQQRLTLDDVTRTVFTFPTMSEAIKVAAQSFRRDPSRLACCVE